MENKLYIVKFEFKKSNYSTLKRYTFSTYEQAIECFDKFVSKIKESKYFNNESEHIVKDYYSWGFTHNKFGFCLSTVTIFEENPTDIDRPFDESLNIDKFIEYIFQ